MLVSAEMKMRVAFLENRYRVLYANHSHKAKRRNYLFHKQTILKCLQPTTYIAEN